MTTVTIETLSAGPRREVPNETLDDAVEPSISFRAEPRPDSKRDPEAYPLVNIASSASTGPCVFQPAGKY